MKPIQYLAAIFSVCFSIQSAQALELDWSGEFRSEFHLIKNYNMDSSNQNVDPGRIITAPNGATPPTNVSAPGGYYIPPGGSSNATFETLFLKLQPKVIVNDNIAIKSEVWFGNPAYGAFGDAYPQTVDGRQFNSTQSRGSLVSAQRLWADLTTDFGVLTIGRAPLQWGLGAVWNAGDGPFDKFESTADQIKLSAKFGSFTFSPGMAVYSTGDIFGGSGTCTFTGGANSDICAGGAGGGGVNDYFIQLKYDSVEDEFEGGVNFIRRIVGGSQDNASSVPSGAGAEGPLNPTVPWNTQYSAGMAYNTWDVYVQKKLNKFRFAAEVPVTSGQVNGADYSAVSVVGEADWRINDPWEMRLRAGRVPGQPDSGGPNLSSFKAYYLNPDYQVGTILFNYNLVNLGGYYGPNTLNNPNANQSNLRSPFDNSITNATYLSWTGVLHADKWTFNTGLLWAKATQTANGSDAYFFNSSKKALEQMNTIGKSQGSNLGLEWDTGIAFQWDEAFLFRLDLAMLFPGDYFAFSNTATDNTTSTVYASVFRVGVKF